MAVHLGIFGLLGALIGAVAGSIGVLAKARGDRRLRLRDEIADAVGLPVLASVSSYRATDVSDWAYLLEHYSPTAVEAWSLRKTLHHLGLDVKGGAPALADASSRSPSDDKALPLGPQLAALRHLDRHLHLDRGRHPPGAAPARLPSDIHLVVVDRDAPHLTGTDPHHQHDRRPVGRHGDGRGTRPAGRRGRGRRPHHRRPGRHRSGSVGPHHRPGLAVHAPLRFAAAHPPHRHREEDQMSNQPYTEPVPTDRSGPTTTACSPTSRRTPSRRTAWSPSGSSATPSAGTCASGSCSRPSDWLGGLASDRRPAGGRTCRRPGCC